MPDPVIGKSGRLVVSYENGQKWIEGGCANGQFEGPVRMWREDGTLFSEENYKCGKMDGKLTWWFANGKRQMEVDCIGGKRNGFWVEWDETGREKSRRQFIDDREVKNESEAPLANRQPNQGEVQDHVGASLSQWHQLVDNAVLAANIDREKYEVGEMGHRYLTGLKGDLAVAARGIDTSRTREFYYVIFGSLGKSLGGGVIVLLDVKDQKAISVYKLR